MRALIVLLLLAAPVLALAAPRHLPFDPADAEVAFRAYGMGLLPIDAHFARFQGALVYDPDDHAACQVELRVEVASLIADDASLRGTILGPDFMDATNFPTLAYTGACDRTGLGGRLAMHGVTRDFILSLDWQRGQVVAEGRLLRADWGMTALPLLGGRTVRIRVTVQLPPADGRAAIR